MSRWGKKRALGLLTRRAGGLSDAEGMWLEDYLQRAPASNEAVAFNSLLRVASRVDVDELSSRQRERLLDRALSDGAQAASIVPAESRSWSIALWTAPAVAAAALALVFFVGGESPSEPVAAQTAEHANPVVLSGTILSEDGELESGEMVDSELEFAASDDASIEVARAVLEFDGKSVARWSAKEQTLELKRGRVRAAVETRTKDPFRISTRRFTVVVVGTEFDVSQDEVKVFEGVVRIESPEGEVLADAVVAGGAWSLAEEETLEGFEEHDVAAVEPRKSTKVVLGEARELVSLGKTDEARRVIGGALSRRPSRRHAAEARSLLAEAALMDGNDGRAVKLYLAVSRRYRSLSAGENALFAAARIRTKSGQTAKAKTLLKRYLSRYPSGRFADAAERRLDELAE